MEKIEHVSDTALIVAGVRAIESERPDALVRDPFAARLAGEKGMAIARSASALPLMCFGIGVRSRFVDDLVRQSVVDGIRTVLNPGAGLDTRPWRMDLPADLRWIEVDFPAMLDYKASRLEGHAPNCSLERISADLTNEADRRRVFESVGPAPALMITEGLLMYLPRSAVSALAAEPLACSGIRRWIFDVASLDLMRAAHGDITQAIESVRAEDHLTGRDILDTVVAGGWRTAAFRSYARDGAPLAMERVMALVGSRPMPSPPENDPSGIYLFQHP